MTHLGPRPIKFTNAQQRRIEQCASLWASALGGRGMRRREFIGLLGGAAAAWPLETGAQQRTQMRHIGFLIGLPADDPEGHARHAAFLQGLQELGWTVGRNLRMDYRSAAGVLENYPKYAAELIAAGSDVLVAGGTAALAALMQATRTLPIVFANAVDPVGS